MIKTELNKKVIMEKEVINKLHKHTKSKSIRNFIKTFIDWMLENNIRIDVFRLTGPEYTDNDKDRPIHLEGCCSPYASYHNYCTDLTGLSEEDFCYWISEASRSIKLFKYKGLLIRPLYTIGTNRCFENYCYNPRFVVFYPKEVKEIK